MVALELAGRRFGKLLVVERADREGKKRARWLCRCDCGNETKPTATDLNTGETRSCGCLRRETMQTHGRHATREYTSWESMIQRCENPSCKEFGAYGGRGISICVRWRRSFVDFLSDMGPRPPGTSIDRVNNNGNYEPGNCRWATKREQQRNLSTNRTVIMDGRKITIAEAAPLVGLSPHTVYNRIYRGEPEHLWMTPLRRGRPPKSSQGSV